VPPPPSTLVDSEEEYEVKEILDSCMLYIHLEYLERLRRESQSMGGAFTSTYKAKDSTIPLQIP
jgi:hypothetical protein